MEAWSVNLKLEKVKRSKTAQWYFSQQVSTPSKAVLALYMVVCRVAKCNKPHTIAEQVSTSWESTGGQCHDLVTH